jgi:hypothetical protein
MKRLNIQIDDFKCRVGMWAKAFSSDVGCKIKYQTRSYRVWVGMCGRCADNMYMRKTRPTYIGCTMSDNFKDFQFFADWHTTQVGYYSDKYELDKDILFEENKIYSENTCVLIPASLNTFLCANDAIRGKLPQGMSFHKNSGKYLAQINKDGKGTHIGYYRTIDAAAAAYRLAKETEAKRWYDRLIDKEFIVDPRVIERMRTWTFKEVDSESSF